MQYTTIRLIGSCIVGCVIRISKILLYAIHNLRVNPPWRRVVVLSGFQRYFCMQYTTMERWNAGEIELCYQDFKDTFVCNTQQSKLTNILQKVVLSGFQRYFCMQYTTWHVNNTRQRSLCYQDFKDTFVCNTQLAPPLQPHYLRLCYQDFKDTFVCNTQHKHTQLKSLFSCVIRISKILLYAIHNKWSTRNRRSRVVLSGFQRYFCMQYTTRLWYSQNLHTLCYQDFKDTFVCNTQLLVIDELTTFSCVIRISKILLYAIHNCAQGGTGRLQVVLSGFQRYFCMQYTTCRSSSFSSHWLCYQDFKDTFVCNTQLK